MRRTFAGLLLTIFGATLLPGLAIPCPAQQLDQWPKFIDIVGHFEILLPHLPSRPSIELHNPAPREYSVRLYTMRSSGRPVMWVAGYIDYQSLPSLTPQQFVQDVFMLSMSKSGSKSSDFTPIHVETDFGNYPGVRFRFNGKKFHIEDINIVNASAADEMMPNPPPPADNVISGEMFLVRHRLFVILSMAAPANLDERQTKTFFDSFRIVNAMLVP